MKECIFCKRRQTKYSCTLCGSGLCNVCSESVDETEDGYDEESYRVGKCPRGACKVGDNDLVESTTIVNSDGRGGEDDGKTVNKTVIPKKNKVVDNSKDGKPVNILNYFGKAGKKKSSPPLKRICDENENSSEPSEPTKNKRVKTDKGRGDVGQPNKPDDICDDLSDPQNEIFSVFKKVFSDLVPSHIHNYHFCTEINCKDICTKDSATMKKDNKFQHKWLFDPKYARCEKTKK